MRWRTLWVLLFVSVAGADEVGRDSARAQFQLGTQAYEEGRYREAALRFEEGYALAHLPALLFNEAQAWRRDYEQRREPASRHRAITCYREFLGLDGTSSADRGEAAAYLEDVSRDASPATTPPVSSSSPSLTPHLPALSSSAAARAKPPRRRTALWVAIAVIGAAAVAGLTAGLVVGLADHASGPSVTPQW